MTSRSRRNERAGTHTHTHTDTHTRTHMFPQTHTHTHTHTQESCAVGQRARSPLPLPRVQTQPYNYIELACFHTFCNIHIFDYHLFICRPRTPGGSLIGSFFRYFVCLCLCLCMCVCVCLSCLLCDNFVIIMQYCTLMIVQASEPHAWDPPHISHPHHPYDVFLHYILHWTYTLLFCDTLFFTNTLLTLYQHYTYTPLVLYYTLITLPACKPYAWVPSHPPHPYGHCNTSITPL
jgi:hypothetical protein